MGQCGLAWVMARQVEGSEHQNVLVHGSKDLLRLPKWGTEKFDSVKEELSGLWVRLQARVQLRTAPRFPNSC